MTVSPRTPRPVEHLLRDLAALAGVDVGPRDDLAVDFFTNNWSNAADLLRRTDRLRVHPVGTDAPRVLAFEVDTRYLRKAGADAPVELAEGPLRGTIHYPVDPFAAVPQGVPAVAVTLDSEQATFHPNYSRRFGILCTGHLPPLYPLEDLLVHLYTILTYQNIDTTDSADPEAAQYFAAHPEAIADLRPVAPLY